ncbi:aminotransferase class III-fold pyridoxal phosphate-dependent enzyme [Desulfobacter sp.]|uniref:aminotransferase class III-fold pyridoxal phosphate-dependent enzyme n=1 Tax=Desulfobacter sp. TaxID=2294 RepID=UPI003D0B0106
MRKIHNYTGFSTESDNFIFNLENNFGARHYNRINLVVRRAKGCWLTDDKGNKYLDCLAAYSAANPGHHHPTITNALLNALTGNYASVISNVVFTDPLGIFLSECAAFAPQLAPRFGAHGNKVLAKNGGVASVETALKTMRYYGFKQKGIEDGNAMEFCRKLMKEGLIVNDSHGHTIRISPPLVINDEEMDFMVERLERVLVS